MKYLCRFAFALLFFTIVTTTEGQRILLVDNNPGAPTDDGKTNSFVYNDLPSALAAAIAGDILHIKPSPNDYGDATITTDDISLIGIGFNPDKDLPITSAIDRLDVDASNVRIAGLVIDVVEIINTTGAGNTATGISIEGCQIRQVLAASSDDFADNIIVRNCLLGNDIGNNNSNRTIDFGANTSNAIITNNIIAGSIGATGLGAVSAQGALIKNNLFVGNGDALRKAFSLLANSTVNNNIFYGRSPQFSTSSTTNVFNSNVSVGVATGDEVFPPIGGTGDTEDANNIEGHAAAPSPFTDANIVTADVWILSWDQTLDPTNAATWINTGTDGTNRGPTGSTLGFSTTGTPVPVIRIFNTTEIIKQGTDLNVTIEAQGN
ncbi:MAG: hypothetical protein ABJP45_08085 [Cyclobacteriaceae bacterium]